jgi:hypothetical protein
MLCKNQAVSAVSIDAEKAVFRIFCGHISQLPEIRVESRTISTASQYANVHSPSFFDAVVRLFT